MTEENTPATDSADAAGSPDVAGEQPDATEQGGPDAQQGAASADKAAPAEEKPKRGRPKGKKSAGFELVLTVRGSEDGTDWNAEVTQGGKKVLSDLGISAAAVSAAAKDLHPDIAEAIDSVLTEARDRHRARVEQLQAELEAAQKALADLED